MEMWRAQAEEPQQRPKVLDARVVFAVFIAHIAFFVGLWIIAWVKDLWPVEPEEIIPIDLTVVVVENLDGKPDEPPPLKKPEPPPPPPPPAPKPKPKPKPKEPEKPKELDKIATNIVEKVEKKPEKKEPAPPKKTAKELREERIKRMRENAKDTKRKVVPTRPAAPQPNGKTDVRPKNWEELLNKGYKPGSSTNLAASEEQLCFSLIRQAFEEKWDTPPWTDTLKPMTIRVWFGGGGRVLRFRLESSSGDPKVDATIKSAASRVVAVRGLTAGFVEKYRRDGVPCKFTVRPQ